MQYGAEADDRPAIAGVSHDLHNDTGEQRGSGENGKQDQERQHTRVLSGHDIEDSEETGETHGERQ
jgi:hypothetical protein